MRLSPLLLAVLLTAPALAETRAPVAAPVRLGRFNDWQAATHLEGGRTTCYAFTRARHSQPRLAGRGDVILSVTERTHGHEQVAIAAGFAFPPGAGASINVAGKRLDLYVAGRSAFARHGAEAVAAFTGLEQAAATLGAPRGVVVTDGFSLNGFGAAYAAIRKACPPS